MTVFFKKYREHFKNILEYISSSLVAVFLKFIRLNFISTKNKKIVLIIVS